MQAWLSTPQMGLESFGFPSAAIVRRLTAPWLLDAHLFDTFFTWYLSLNHACCYPELTGSEYHLNIAFRFWRYKYCACRSIFSPDFELEINSPAYRMRNLAAVKCVSQVLNDPPSSAPSSRFFDVLASNLLSAVITPTLSLYATNLGSARIPGTCTRHQE